MTVPVVERIPVSRAAKSALPKQSAVVGKSSYPKHQREWCAAASTCLVSLQTEVLSGLRRADRIVWCQPIRCLRVLATFIRQLILMTTGTCREVEP